MVLLAAAICNKSGKTLLSRQFVEMSRSRIEGLLSAFPKLITSGKQVQHTFVETDSVRYVYQPLDKLYVMLITTKASNMLEDLETLRLFARIIPEYCRTLDEADIIEEAFQLLFAFDEVVALGYRESVNIAQIRTFTEMDSHEERLVIAVRKSQEQDAKEKMKLKAKELSKARQMGLAGMGGANMRSMPGMINSGGGQVPSRDTMPTADAPTVKKSAPAAAPSRNAMRLGGKGKDVDNFLDTLAHESGKPVPARLAPQGDSAVVPGAAVDSKEPIMLRLEEKMSCVINKTGRVETLEVQGMMSLRIRDPSLCKVRITMASLPEPSDSNGNVQFVTHPLVNKQLFQASHTLAAKNPAKPFVPDQDLGLLRWNSTSDKSDAIPVVINFWPSPGVQGLDVSVEMELNNAALKFGNVCLSIPLPTGVSNTVKIDTADGSVDNKRSCLLWSVPFLDKDNANASLEFNIGASNVAPESLYPVALSWDLCSTLIHDVAVATVTNDDASNEVDFGLVTQLSAEKYEIV